MPHTGSFSICPEIVLRGPLAGRCGCFPDRFDAGASNWDRNERMAFRTIKKNTKARILLIQNMLRIVSEATWPRLP